MQMVTWALETMGAVAVVSGIIFVTQSQVRRTWRRRHRHGR